MKFEFRALRIAAVAATAISMAACSEQGTAPDAEVTLPGGAVFATLGTPPTVRRDLEGQVWLCKAANAGAPQESFNFDYSATKPVGSSQPDLAPGSVSIKNGECALLYALNREVSVGRYALTITEGAMPNADWSFTSAGATTIAPFSSTILGTQVVSGQTISNVGFIHDQGVVVTVTNTYTAPTGEIGNFVWNDLNGNGVQDGGEPGIAGVTVTLGGAASQSTTTSATGGYLFSGLSAGNYTVTVDATTLPAGLVPTTTGQGTTATDHNGSPANVTLPTSSSSDLTIDFGYVQPTIGGGEGCTPGYWKQSQHFDSWVGYSTTDMVDAIFGVTFRSVGKNNPTGPLTLLQALELKGNNDGEQLFRHGTAALLNGAAQSGVSANYTAAEVILMVRNAWNSGNATTIANTKSLLASANEQGCPLN